MTHNIFSRTICVESSVLWISEEILRKKLACNCLKAVNGIDEDFIFRLLERDKLIAVEQDDYSRAVILKAREIVTIGLVLLHTSSLSSLVDCTGDVQLWQGHLLHCGAHCSFVFWLCVPSLLLFWLPLIMAMLLTLLGEYLKLFVKH